MNPKAETVEELQRRRKGLHLGMCKLLREDLSIMAEHRAEEVLAYLSESAAQAFSALRLVVDLVLT